MNLQRGIQHEPFNVVQSKFKINTQNCYFAAALCSYSNNVIKRQVTDEEMRDVERIAHESFVMPKRGGGLQGGVKAVARVLKREFEFFERGSHKFHKYLREGKVIVVDMIPSQGFVDQRRGDGIIESGDKRFLSSGHITCMFERDMDKYILNSWRGTKYKKIKSLQIPGVFKTWSLCGIIL